MDSPGSASSSWCRFARQVIEYVVRGVDPARAEAPPDEGLAHGGVFVTLRCAGRLRGCMGILDPHLPLAQAVLHAAVCAATEDPRFPPLSAAEAFQAEIEVSVLSSAIPMERLDELELGRHGVLIRRGGRRGLFLPQVAVEHHMDRETFLSRCCVEKAGLPPDAWKDPATEVLLFTTTVHREQLAR